MSFKDVCESAAKVKNTKIVKSAEKHKCGIVLCGMAGVLAVLAATALSILSSVSEEVYSNMHYLP